MTKFESTDIRLSHIQPRDVYLLLLILLLLCQIILTITQITGLTVLFILLTLISLLTRWWFRHKVEWMLLDFAVLTGLAVILGQPDNLLYLSVFSLYFNYHRRMLFSLPVIGLILLIHGTESIWWLIASLIAGSILMLWETDQIRNFSHDDTLRMQKYSMEQSQQRLLSDFSEVEKMTRYEERQKLAQILHDNLGHDLTAADLTQKAAAAMLDAGKHDEAKDMLSQAGKRLQNALEQLKDSVQKIEPEEQSGFAELNQLIVQSLLPVQFTHEGNLTKIKPFIWQMIITTTREALTNIIKHAKPQIVSVSLSVTDTIVRMVIINDGVSHQINRSEGSGLRYMRERLEAANGSLSLQKKNNHFHLVMTVPLESRSYLKR